MVHSLWHFVTQQLKTNTGRNVGRTSLGQSLGSECPERGRLVCENGERQGLRKPEDPRSTQRRKAFLSRF